MLKTSSFSAAIDFIRKSGRSISFAITGGGSSAVPMLLEDGGMSEVFEQAFIPYSQKSLEKFLGFSPDKSCSEKTAEWMGQKLVELSPTRGYVALAVTASLAKRDNEREGRVNEAFVHIVSTTGKETVRVCFCDKEKNDPQNYFFFCPDAKEAGARRNFQETVLSMAVVSVLAKHIGFEES